MKGKNEMDMLLMLVLVFIIFGALATAAWVCLESASKIRKNELKIRKEVMKKRKKDI